jgi:hypothetical protein
MYLLTYLDSEEKFAHGPRIWSRPGVDYNTFAHVTKLALSGHLGYYCKVSCTVDRENRGFVGVLADANSIPTSTPITAFRLARSLSPRSRAHIPFIRLCPRPNATAPSTPNRFVLDSAMQHLRRPLVHQRASPLPRGHFRDLAPARWATPTRFVSSRSGLVLGYRVPLLRSH